MWLRSVQSLLGKKVLHRLLGRIDIGRLTIRYESSGETHRFGHQDAVPYASMTVRDDHVPWEILTLSELGLGLAYVKGRWTSDSPYRVLLVLMLNERRLRRFLMRSYRFDTGALRLVLGNKRRTSRNHLVDHCRKEVARTYDTGNDFYRWMLGPSMTYSCAIWPHRDATLEEAQEHKMDVIVDKLDIRPDHRVLDIGCGWGTLCAHIAQRTGASVRGIALSRNQIRGCEESFPQLDFDYRDYREERGRYDRIVSVGMVEHVGPENLPTFCQSLVRLLEPGGRCLIHWVGPWNDILIDQDGTRHPNWASVLMPNAVSPTHSEFIIAAMATGGLRLLHTETFGIHYARTGTAWLDNLARHRDDILRRYPHEVLRSHEYAWHVGRAALETGYTLVQMVLEKRPYGSDYRQSAVDVSAARTR